MRRKLFKTSKFFGNRELILLASVVVIACAFLGLLVYDLLSSNTSYSAGIPPTSFEGKSGFVKFSSDEEFKNFLLKTSSSAQPYYGVSFGTIKSIGGSSERQLLRGAETDESNVRETSAVEPERYSQTNVQVLGIDEPDIVKTDGKNIFYAFSANSYYWPYYWDRYGFNNLKTLVLNAFPPEDLSVKNKINDSGQLLLTKNNLIVLSNKHIRAYDKESLNLVWELKLNKSSIIAARLYNDELYVVLNKVLNYYNPIPIKPLDNVVFKPTEVYYPVIGTQLDTTYFVIKLNPSSGSVLGKTAFLAPSSQTTVYMSKDNIFIGIHYRKTEYEIMKNFIFENSDLFPKKLVERLSVLDTYDISEYSKLHELNTLLQQYYLSLDPDEELKLRNELNNFIKKHNDELEKTILARVELPNLVLKSTTEVNGRLMNQFSMDEYNNYLRVAVTLGFGDNSKNKIYVLNKNLRVVGSTENFGTTERIYSVRFVNDKAYIVTYRRVDPFFVMDLSNPEKPEIRGELKIPGYSSYLHPITNDLILGIGKENSNIKVSLFDVSDIEKPIELDKYILLEYWSDVVNNHHAFLLDKKHNIFFIPGSRGAYIFSYSDNKLELKLTLEERGVVRAIYIDDYLYVITREKIVVVDEKTWKRIKELEFE